MNSDEFNGEPRLARLPTRAVAERILVEGARLNPGPWVDHSRFVAAGAEAIAQLHPALDPEQAYVVGLLHDIGRREGQTNMRHVLDGYSYLMSLDYAGAARICLSHSFVIPNANAHVGVWDCPEEDIHFVATWLAETPYDDYDRLIQLCDALALPQGFVLIEKRLMDVALRHGLNEYSLPRWRVIFDLKRHFDKAIGRSVYDVLPGIVETTFGHAGGG